MNINTHRVQEESGHRLYAHEVLPSSPYPTVTKGM